jgi:hypothetical protein
LRKRPSVFVDQCYDCKNYMEFLLKNTATLFKQQ